MSCSETSVVKSPFFLAVKHTEAWSGHWEKEIYQNALASAQDTIWYNTSMIHSFDYLILTFWTLKTVTYIHSREWHRRKEVTGTRACQSIFQELKHWAENSDEPLLFPGIPPFEKWLQASFSNPHPISLQLPRQLRNSSLEWRVQSPLGEIRRQKLRCNQTEDWWRVSWARRLLSLLMLIFERLGNDLGSVCLSVLLWLITGI